MLPDRSADWKAVMKLTTSPTTNLLQLLLILDRRLQRDCSRSILPISRRDAQEDAQPSSHPQKNMADGPTISHIDGKAIQPMAYGQNLPFDPPVHLEARPRQCLFRIQNDRVEIAEEHFFLAVGRKCPFLHDEIHFALILGHPLPFVNSKLVDTDHPVFCAVGFNFVTHRHQGSTLHYLQEFGVRLMPVQVARPCGFGGDSDGDLVAP